MRFILLFFFNFCFALDITKINNAMKSGNYTLVCQDDVFNAAKLKGDSGLMNTYAMACLKLDYIIKLNPVINFLIQSPEARSNAIFYTTILYKKKLLYSAIIDNIDIKAIKLPKCDYILSDIYDEYINGNYTKEGDRYVFKYKDGTCEVSLSNDKNPKLLFRLLNNNGQIIEIKEYR